jgi:pantoate--beta-alanine ligase
MTAVQRVERIGEIRRLVESWKNGGPIGFVPTMGALHAGHERLIQQARAECARVVVSIFVNPLQFDRKDDLERYPRTLESDAETCERIGVDALFLPAVEEMYPSTPACTVDPGDLATHLCGAYRRGHFRGVATVVLKLLNIVPADRAYFGEKDAQQLAIIRRMVADFDVPMTIVGVPTVREVDGLALSSRNVRLNAHERTLAPRLYQALRIADDLIAHGDTSVAAVKRSAAAVIGSDDLLRLEYLEIVDPEGLQPVETITGPVLVAGALWVGGTRLIDNCRSAPPGVDVGPGFRRASS